MNNRILFWTLVSLVMVSVGLGIYNLFNSASGKLGYVDSERLINEYSESVKISQQIKLEMEKVSRNLSVMDSTIKILSQAIGDSSAKWSGAVRKSRFEVFSRKQDEFNRYRQVSSDQLAKKQQDLMKPILTELDIYIREFARKNGYRLILGTGTGGIILYGDDVADVTEEFVRYVEAR